MIKDHKDLVVLIFHWTTECHKHDVDGKRPVKHTTLLVILGFNGKVLVAGAAGWPVSRAPQCPVSEQSCSSRALPRPGNNSSTAGRKGEEMREQRPRRHRAQGRRRAGGTAAAPHSPGQPHEGAGHGHHTKHYRLGSSSTTVQVFYGDDTVISVQEDSNINRESLSRW